MSVEDFVTRTRKLLEKERDAEIEETRSLPLSTSNVSTKSTNTRASSFAAIDRTGSGQGFDQYLFYQINVICFSLESLIFYLLYALQFDSQRKVAKP